MQINGWSKRGLPQQAEASDSIDAKFSILIVRPVYLLICPRLRLADVDCCYSTPREFSLRLPTSDRFSRTSPCWQCCHFGRHWRDDGNRVSFDHAHRNAAFCEGSTDPASG